MPDETRQVTDTDLSRELHHLGAAKWCEKNGYTRDDLLDLVVGRLTTICLTSERKPFKVNKPAEKPVEKEEET